MNLKKFLENKNLVINTLFIEHVVNLGLTLNEFLVLIYFDNLLNKELNVSQLIDVLKIKENDALTAFNKLIEKKLLIVIAEKNPSGKIIEKVNLDNFYSIVSSEITETKKNSNQVDIYEVFEKEFGRPISSMEYEIINAWLEKSYDQELIIGALKEAIYNGVTNLRYIDKILYEWQRKGLKSMRDVEKHMKERNNKKDNLKEDELFDYNWLDENNE